MFIEEGSEPPMACPYFMARIPSGYGATMYDETGPRRNTQNIIGLEHIDGIRLNTGGMDSGGITGFPSENVVRYIARKAGRPPFEVVQGAGDTMMRLLSKAHEAGLTVGSDLHWGNYTLSLDGRTKSVSDLGSAKEATEEGLALDRRMAASMYLKLAAGYSAIIGEAGAPTRPLQHYACDRAAMKVMFELLRDGLRSHSNERLLLAYDALELGPS